MSDSSFPRRAVEDAIDRAVREMMQADPRPGLRRRVLARLERGSEGPWVLGSVGPWVRGSWGPRLLIPAAAVGAIVLALVFVPSGDKPLEVAETPARSAPSEPPAPSESARERARVRSASIFGHRRDRVSAASIDRPVTPASSLVPFVVEDAPSRLTPIVMTPLPHVNEIRVAPIEIQRITVPALSPPR